MGSDVRFLGLDSIAFGPALIATAGMPTVGNYTSITAIVPGSARLVIEQPGVTEFMIEDSDYPDITVNTQGAKYIEFSTQDMDQQNFYFGMGGVTTATLWKAPVDALGSNEKSVKAYTKISVGGKTQRIDIVRASVRSGFDGDLNKEAVGKINYRCDVLLPYQAATDYPIVIAEI